MFTHEDSFYTDGEPVEYLFALGPYLIVETAGGTIEVRELKAPTKLINTVSKNKDRVSSLASEYPHLYRSRPGGRIEIWDMNQLHMISTFQTQIAEPKDIDLIPNHILVTGWDNAEIIEKTTFKSRGFLKCSAQQPNRPLGRISWGTNYLAAKFSEVICFFSLPGFVEQFLFDKEEYIGSYLVHANHLVIGTDWSAEMSDPCQIDIWRLTDLSRVATFGKYDNFTFVFDLKKYHDPQTDTVYLVATTIDRVEVWEWGTWQLTESVTELVDVNQSLFVGDRLFVGDILGRVDIWQKTE